MVIQVYPETPMSACTRTRLAEYSGYAGESW
jgi:hypothetical protein